jgi:hypothetical protein
MTASEPLNERPYEDAFLLRYSDEHLTYELEMLFGCADIILSKAMITAHTPGDEKIVANLFIEGFGLHLRNVVDFLYPNRLEDTDVAAEDFCTSGVWKAGRPQLPSALNSARTMANKQLAHLTTGRHEGKSEAKSWRVDSLIQEIKQVLGIFASKARTSALSPSVTALIRRKCAY